MKQSFHAARKIVTIVGARPQFIKAAALRAAFDETSDFTEVLVHTGQHYDANMSEVFFSELGLRPAEYYLKVEGRSHGAMTGHMLAELEKILLKERPQAVLIYGDTNSTLAGALAATKMHIPVIHVEAGLRSFNKTMPEEVNRILTDHISDLLFCSTDLSVQNLANESIRDGVHLVGDIMYDVTLRFGDKADKVALKSKYCQSDKPLALLTLHRAENFSSLERATEILQFVTEKAEAYNIVFPIHPGTKAKLKQMNLELPDGVQSIDPLPYTKLQGLIGISDLILTDSGGLQKEAYFHRTPCITLRDETEWQETIEAGWNALWTNPVFNERRDISDYGRGDTAERIIRTIRKVL